MHTEIGIDRQIESLLGSDEWPLRWQRKLGLVPREGMGLGRRAVLYALLAWAPIAAWALMKGHALPGGVAEPLLAHFGVNVRCLVAIPLLILAEGMALSVTVGMATKLVANGIVTEVERPKFSTILRDVARLRDSSLPWIVVLGVTVAWMLADRVNPGLDALSWALDASGNVGFGGLWFSYVARPIYLALLLGWLWRIVLVLILFRKISQLDLSLVPTHPDGAGGLGFLEAYPGAFALVSFALAALIGSRWAHEVVYHGEHVQSLVRPFGVFAVVWALLLLSPLLVFMPKLMAAKRQAKTEYGRLVGTQGRLVRRRWILGETAADDERLLEPAGIGPVADAAVLYAAVTRMRIVPIGKVALTAVLLPLALPVLAVFAIEIPIKTLLMKLFGLLF